MIRQPRQRQAATEPAYGPRTFSSGDLRKTRPPRWPLLLLLGVSAVSLPAFAGGQPAFPMNGHATLKSTRLAATGPGETLLDVSDFGRYAITAKSAQGVALQIVDRMSGPGKLHGKAGREDGRLDLFLDGGSYLVRTFAAATGSGQVELEAAGFRERNLQPLPILEKYKLVRSHLRDLEQRSYWLQVGGRGWVTLEGAGRYLADLRLWRDGSWLVGSEPEVTRLESDPERPLVNCRLAAELEPGLYLVTFYGGPGLTWSVESKDSPLYVRFGIPELPAEGRRRFEVSSFGIDRWLVPGRSDHFRLELPKAREARLGVGWYTTENLFENDIWTGDLDKRSNPPLIELSATADSTRTHLVTVTGLAGQPYVLEHFPTSKPPTLGGDSGRFWLETLSSGDPRDSLDSTSLILRRRQDRKRNWSQEVVAHTALEMGENIGFVRRFNLLGTSTLFLEVLDRGSYGVWVEGNGSALVRIEPYFPEPPEHYSPPPFQAEGAVFELDPGLHVVTLKAIETGSIELVVATAAGKTGEAKAPGKAERRRMERENPRQGASIYQAFEVDGSADYQIVGNQRPGIIHGFLQRPLPLDLQAALPVVQKGNSTLELPVLVREGSVLHVLGDHGQPVPFSLDGTPKSGEALLSPGGYQVSIENPENTPLVYSLYTVPLRLDPKTPLSTLPPRALEKLPSFPILQAGKPLARDLGASQEATFLVRADEPRLYQIQSTGLLATSGTLRTRMVPDLARKARNGVGRNFLLQEYLREGDYQVTVKTLGRSAGHLGLELLETPLLQGGVLREGEPSRIRLNAGEAVEYWFTIPERAFYRLRGIGQNRSFRCRLEDSEGWPLLRPDSPADITREFEAGRYRFILLPESVETRRLALLEKKPEAPKLTGHGPHSVPLGKKVSHVWREPAGQGERLPDIWEFKLPARADLRILPGREMEGELKQWTENHWTGLHQVSPRGWHGRLDAGRYRLEVACTRDNDLWDYEIKVTTEQLVAETSKPLTAPGDLGIAMGESGQVEISSLCDDDVSGTLRKEDGKLIAQNDDRPNDWNFLLSTAPGPGIYNLTVTPVGADSANCIISMRRPKWTALPPVQAPGILHVTPGDSILEIPLELPSTKELLLAVADSATPVGIALERLQEGNWIEVTGEMARQAESGAPLKAKGHQARIEALLDGRWQQTRLRVWSPDGDGSPVTIGLYTASPEAVPEAELERGLTLAGIGVDAPVLAVAAVDLEAPGIFRLQSTGNDLRICQPGMAVCQRIEGKLISLGKGKSWWILPPSPTLSVSAKRVHLEKDELSLSLDGLPRIVCDVAPKKPGPFLVRAMAQVGQPGLALLPDPGGILPGSGKRDREGQMAVSTRSAVVVSPGGERGALLLWNADESQPLGDLRLRLWSFDPPTEEAVEWGSWSRRLEAGTAHRLELPEGLKQVRLALDAEVAAAFSQSGKILSTHVVASSPSQELLETTARTVTFLNPSETGRFYSLELLPQNDGRQLVVSPAKPFEGGSWTGEKVRLEVSAPKANKGKTRLRMGGCAENALLVGANGTVARGMEMTITSSLSTLLFQRKKCQVMAWIEEGQIGSSGPWPTTAAPIGASAPATGQLELRSQAMAIEFAPPRGATGATLVLFRTATAVACRQGSGLAPMITSHPEGAWLPMFFPSGRGTLELRPLEGKNLWGFGSFLTVLPESLGEGPNGELFLGRGEARLFSFEVQRAGPVGIGIQSSSGTVEADLYDHQGNLLAKGLAMMPKLEPGLHYIVVSVPPEGAPGNARIAIVGLEQPGSGPPPDVVHNYLEAEQRRGEQ